MIEVLNIIKEQFPILAMMTNIIFVIFLILGVADDFDKIKSFIKRLFDFRKHMDTLIYSKRRDVYNKVLASDNFLKWQFKVLKEIYAPLIEDFRNKDDVGGTLDFTKISFDENNESGNVYESITYKVNPIDYPFAGVCDKRNLHRDADITKQRYDEAQKGHKWRARRYYRLIKQTIRYPKRLGYMLDEIQLKKDSNLMELTAYVGNYENNLKTSHILEYEMYRLYIKMKLLRMNPEDKSKEELLEMLPIRKSIHKSFGSEEWKVLISGKGRSSLLGVQLFVLVKNYQGNYDALRIRRSKDVAAKPGFLQFIPSGGFEAMNDCVDLDAQWDNYSITKAVFRELLEECFGQDEDDKRLAGNNVSPDKIYGNTQVKNIINMIENGKAQMQLLGSAMNLVGLRHELSFILKVDDKEMSSSFISNYESKTPIHMIDINCLEEREFWKDDDLKKLNCTSAALFELARSSEIYKSCLKSKGTK